MNKLYRHVAALTLCLSILIPAQAMAELDAYAGVSVGQATLKRQGQADDTDLGYKLFAGLHATGPFSVEISHVRLGKYVNDNIEASGNAIHLVGNLPFSPRLAALAKAGFFSWDVENTSTNTSTTGTDTTYGFALTYLMFNGMTLRVEWENYSDVGKVNSNSGNDMTLASVGVSIRF